jgi:hypothetical protein
MSVARLQPLTTEQYHAMVRHGIILSGSPIELLDGYLILKDRSVGADGPRQHSAEHAFVLDALRELFSKEKRGRPGKWFGSTQHPITIFPNNEPEPDGLIIRGVIREYNDHHPSSADVTCAIEVSGNSLNFDRVTKQRIYADAAIPQYIIINLVESIAEEYTLPVVGEGRYANVVRHERGSKVRFMLPQGQHLEIAVEQLLP